MWYDINCKDRIIAWRNWRKQLELLDWNPAINEVATNWNKVPVVQHYLLPDQVKEWPTPWQLINENIYCDLAKALGIFYTLSLLDFPKQTKNLKLCSFEYQSDWANVCIVNNAQNELSVLNWHVSEIVNISTLPINIENANFSYSEIDLANKIN